MPKMGIPALLRFFSRNVHYRTVLRLATPDNGASTLFRRRLMFKISSITLAAVLTLGASAQAQTQTQVPADSGNPTPTYRINVVSRTTRAVSYRHRSGATKINFQGTELMPGAAGEAKVESKRGTLAVEAEFSGLNRPTSFGNEYLTYVLWAISPEGRPVNIGEVLVGDNHRSKLDVTTDLQAFAMIVTAEPYYACAVPATRWSLRTPFARIPRAPPRPWMPSM